MKKKLPLKWNIFRWINWVLLIIAMLLLLILVVVSVRGLDGSDNAFLIIFFVLGLAMAFNSVVNLIFVSTLVHAREVSGKMISPRKIAFIMSIICMALLLFTIIGSRVASIDADENFDEGMSVLLGFVVVFFLWLYVLIMQSKLSRAIHLRNVEFLSSQLDSLGQHEA